MWVSRGAQLHSQLETQISPSNWQMREEKECGILGLEDVNFLPCTLPLLDLIHSSTNLYGRLRDIV